MKILETDLIDDDVTPVEDDANTRAVDQIDTDIKGLNGAYWVVSKINPANRMGPRGYCFRCEATEAPSVDELKEKIMREVEDPAGDYQCMLKVGKLIKHNFIAAIAPRQKLKERVESSGTDVSAALATANAPIMELIRATQLEAAETRKMLLSSGKSSINETVALMTAMGTMMKALMPAGRSGNSDPIEMMKQMFMLKKMMDAEFGGGDHEPEWWERAIDKAAPLVMGAVNAFGANRATMYLPAENTQATPGGADVNPVDTIIVGLLKPYAGLLQTINNGAENQADPETYADILLDQLPDSVQFMGQTVELSNDLIRQGLTRPDVLDIFMRVYPPARPYRDWYGKLIRAVLALLDESDNPDGGDTA